MRLHKYRAQATEVDGIRFSSKAESRRYTELKLLEKAGEIHALALQPRFTLATPSPNDPLPFAIGHYVADFFYCTCRAAKCVREPAYVVVEDVKGFKTQLYKWKKKHAEAQYGIEIRETGARRGATRRRRGAAVGKTKPSKA